VVVRGTTNSEKKWPNGFGIVPFSPGEAPGIKDQTNDASQPGAEAAGRHDGQPNATRLERLNALWEKHTRGGSLSGARAQSLT